MKFKIPRIPFLFFGPDGQMEVVVDTSEELNDPRPTEPFWPRVLGYQAHIMNNVAAEQPTQVAEIGLVHATEHEVIEALQAGIDTDLDLFGDPRDPRRRALEALTKAREVEVMK